MLNDELIKQQKITAQRQKAMSDEHKKHLYPILRQKLKNFSRIFTMQSCTIKLYEYGLHTGPVTGYVYHRDPWWYLWCRSKKVITYQDVAYNEEIYNYLIDQFAREQIHLHISVKYPDIVLDWPLQEPWVEFYFQWN